MLLAAQVTQASHYGYWGAMALVGAESLGVPVPGETALIAAAAYAGASHAISPWLLFVLVSIAAVGGSVASYFVGRLGGYPLARRYGGKVRLDERKLKIGRYVLDRHGWKVIAVARFVAVLRAYTSFVAGTLEMRYTEFVVATSAAAVAWAGLYTAAAYNAAGELKRLSTPIEVAFVGLALVALAVAYFFVRGHLRNLGDKAEAAYPGPIM